MLSLSLSVLSRALRNHFSPISRHLLAFISRAPEYALNRCRSSTAVVVAAAAAAAAAPAAAASSYR